MVTRLAFPGGSLQFELEGKDWCQVVLDIDGRRVALGADTKSKIVTGLRLALQHEPVGSTTSEFEGLEVRWIMSLSERHCSLYVGDRDGTRLVFIQGADGALIARLAIAAEDIAACRDKLAGRIE